MDLKSLMSKPVNAKRRKIVGRGPGSGHGKQAGRGGKGARARSGYSWKAYFEGGQMPLYRRLPKKGFRNGRFRKSYAIVNVRDLAKFASGATIDVAAVHEAGLINNAGDGLRVLGAGEITTPVVVRASHVSEVAATKIKAAGGSIEIVRKKKFRRKR